MKRLAVSVAAFVLAVGVLAPLGARTSEEEKIEAVIAAVIEAYRKGDSAALGRYYAPEVTVVPGDYNPPVEGWAKVEPRYRQMYASLSGVEMIRENTRVFRRGNVAWAVYQWRFAGSMGAQLFGAQGHTTLVLEKRKGQWVIRHNHTSVVPAPGAPAETQTGTSPPPS